MKRARMAVTALPNVSKVGGISFEVAQLLDIFARIERRRQARLREVHAGQTQSPSLPVLL